MLQLILGVAVVATLFYYFGVKPMYYWRDRNVLQKNPVWVFGDNWGKTFGKESFFDLVVRVYNQFPETRYHGIYELTQPALLIKDPELLKQVTVRDFEHFVDHRTVVPEEVDPIWGKNLFALKGQKWRDMRSILSPSFTSSKMRTVFVLISKCSEDFVNHFLEKNQECVELEMKDSFTRFASDVIASAAFGVKVDSLGEPNNEFYLRGKEATNFGGFLQSLKLMGFLMIPKVLQFFKIPFISPAVRRFFCYLVDDTIKAREKDKIVRPDMIHLLMEARKGTHHTEKNIRVDAGFTAVKEADIGREQIIEITNTDIAAQALVFFFAGFDSVSTLLCFMSYELALNPDIQTKLRKEIEDTLESCKGKISYEVLLKMKYMDMVVSECLRKWPSSVTIDRVCTKPYTIKPANADEKPLYIEKNTVLMFPVIGIHRDPKYYRDPTRFDPERFSDENKRNIDPFTYFPFGLGPRNCIGLRFALLETKIVFFHLLSQFELVTVEKTPIPMKLSKKTFNLQAENGFWLGLHKLKNKLA